MSKIKIKNQCTPFGCFINCFGMVKSKFEEDYDFTDEDEIKLLEESFRFHRECYEPYLINQLKQDYRLNVNVESEYLYWRYKELSKNLENGLQPQHKILSAKDYIAAVEYGLAIVLLDKWHLDMYTHFAHWVVISDFEDGEFLINDSWTGREIRMPEERFMDSIKSLKERLRCSPVLIEVRK